MAVSRFFSVQFNGVSVSAVQDLFNITAASDRTAVIREIRISQSSDVGDAAEEGLLIALKSGQTTNGTGGTTPSAVAFSLNQGSAGFSARANDATTQASGGTIVTHWSEVWNIRMPWIWLPPTGYGIALEASRKFTVDLETAPADAITTSGTIVVEEFG